MSINSTRNFSYLKLISQKSSAVIGRRGKSKKTHNEKTQQLKTVSENAWHWCSLMQLVSVVQNSAELKIKADVAAAKDCTITTT